MRYMNTGSQLSWGFFFFCRSDRSDCISSFGHFIFNKTGYHLIFTAGVVISLCVLPLTALQPPHRHTSVCFSLFFSGRFSQTTGQFSSPHFLIESRSSASERASEHEFPVTPLCLWSISILTSLCHCWTVCWMERGRPSSYPGGSSLVDLHWQSICCSS